jgi:hypothetical protein
MVHDTVQTQFMKMLMGFVGYSGKGLGKIVDIAFRKVIRFYWLNCIPLRNVDAYF